MGLQDGPSASDFVCPLSIELPERLKGVGGIPPHNTVDL